MKVIRGWMLCAVLLLVAGPIVGAETTRVGRIHASVGPAELSRAEAWEPAHEKEELQRGDRLRTGEGGHLKLELEPDSWIELGPNTEIAIERHKYDAAGWSDTLITLVAGSISGSADRAYAAPDWDFRISTPSAQVRAIGGEFAVVHAAALGVTDVSGGRGSVAVRSASDPTVEPVTIGVHEALQVKLGQKPGMPYRTDWLLNELARSDTSRSADFDTGTWSSNAILKGESVVEGDSASGPPESALVSECGSGGGSVGDGNDVGAVLGQPPAALTGPGGLLVFGD